MKVKSRQNYFMLLEVRVVGYKANFWDIDNILFLDSGAGYNACAVCENWFV